MPDKFPVIGFGRIFVTRYAHIEVAERILRAIDPIEYDKYYPKHLVTLYPDASFAPKLIDLNRFQLNARAFEHVCWRLRVPVIVSHMDALQTEEQAKDLYHEEHVYDSRLRLRQDRSWDDLVDLVAKVGEGIEKEDPTRGLDDGVLYQPPSPATVGDAILMGRT